VDVPETEALLYEPNFARIAASAAALAGHGDVSCETFTCIYGFPREKMRQEQTADLKLLADSLFANGVNHVVWHGKPFNRKGSDQVEFYASVHVGPDSPLAEEMPAFNGYMEKVSTAMKRGRSYSGVAQYLPLEDAWMAGLYPEEKRLKWSWGAYELRYEKHAPELRGHHPLWINHRFLKEARFENGLLHAGVLTFSSLLVDAEHLGGEVLATILDLARQGLPVCMKRRPLQAGKNKRDSFKSNLDTLLALTNVSDSFAKTAVRPPLVEGDDLPDYWCRVENGNHIIFFAHPLARNLKHPMAYGQSLTAETQHSGAHPCRKRKRRNNAGIPAASIAAVGNRCRRPTAPARHFLSTENRAARRLIAWVAGNLYAMQSAPRSGLRSAEAHA
jgi:hypothetical protein